MNKKAAHLRELDARVWNYVFNSFAMSAPFSSVLKVITTYFLQFLYFNIPFPHPVCFFCVYMLFQ